MAFRLLNKTQMNFAYGMGASIVIIGALMKITHFQAGFLTGNLMLTIGLVTEAIIFALSAFDPPNEEYNWSLVYPELAISHDGEDELDAHSDDEEADASLSTTISTGDANGDPVSQKLDQMLMDANVGSELIESLGEGLRNFGETAQNLNTVGTSTFQCHW